MKPKTILCIAQNRVLLDVLTEVIEQEATYTVLCAQNREEATTIVETASIALVLIDIALPNNEEGIRFLEYLATTYPEIRLLVYGNHQRFPMFPPDNKIAQSFAAGAHGFLFKVNATSKTVLEVIAKLLRGEQFADPDALHALIQNTRSSPS